MCFLQSLTLSIVTHQSSDVKAIVIQTAIISLLTTSYEHMNTIKVHVWITTKENVTRIVKFTLTKVRQNTKQTNTIAVMGTVRLMNYLLPMYAPFPVLVATSFVSVLQAPDGKGSG